jgi:hypothetical protein
VTIIAILTFLGAMILAGGGVAFFVVAVMGMTGGDAREAVSAAIVGMGVAGGLLLLVLAGAVACLAMGVLELHEWARIVSIASIAACIGCTILSFFAFRGYVVIPVVPSIVCHLIVLTTAAWMLLYLLRPHVKQAFSVLAS